MNTEINKIAITNDEMTTIILALEHSIELLRNSFEEDKRYIHPAIKYEQLLEKLKQIPW